MYERDPRSNDSARQFVNGTFNRRGKESPGFLSASCAAALQSKAANGFILKINPKAHSECGWTRTPYRSPYGSAHSQWGSVNKSSSSYKKAYRAHKYLRRMEHVLSSLTYSLHRLIPPSSGLFPPASIEERSGTTKFIYSLNESKSTRVWSFT